MSKPNYPRNWALALVALSTLSPQLSTPLAAGIITVGNTNDYGAGSLRSSIQYATPGDTINFSVTGQITLTNGQILITKNVTIAGPGPETLAISGNNHSRVFEISPAITVNISGLTIRDGHPADGTDADPKGEHGGGIYNGGTLSLRACSLSGNSAGNGSPALSSGVGGGSGGGLYNQGTLNVIACTISGNTAGHSGGGSDGGSGGGVFNLGTCILDVSTVSGNAASDDGAGGGIYNLGLLTLNASTIVSNSGGPGAGRGAGGGIYNAGTLSANNCTINGNSGGDGRSGADAACVGLGCFYAQDGSPGAGGGGIYNDGNGALSLINCTLADNFGGRGGNGGNGAAASDPSFSEGRSGGTGGAGGGIFNWGALTVLACTVSGNGGGPGGTGGTNSDGTRSAGRHGTGGDGGGVFNASNEDSARLHNTIVAANSVGAGGIGGSAGSAGVGPDLAGPFISEGYNLIGQLDAHAGLSDGGSADRVGTTATPLDPMLGPLQHNGGPTFTMGLLDASPARDAGDDTLLEDPIDLVTDQCGRPRKVGTHIDIGAFELHPLGPSPITVNNSEDNGPGSLRQAIIDALPGDTLQFSVTGIITLTSGELLITKNLAITGPGAVDLAISGNNSSRIFEITPNVTASISDLTIRDGHALYGTDRNGGGIYNSGRLTLTACAISGNTAGSPGGAGGGICNAGTLGLAECMVSSNTAGHGENGRDGYSIGGNAPEPGHWVLGVAGGPGGVGGGIYSEGTLTLTNCTLSGNDGGGGGNGGNGGMRDGSGSTAGGAGGGGGGIYNAGTMALVACTLSGNGAANGGPGRARAGVTGPGGNGGNGGGIFNANTAASVDLRSTLIALNSVGTGGPGGGAVPHDPDGIGPDLPGSSAGAGPDLAGSFNSQGHNLIGQIDDSTGVTNRTKGDLTGTTLVPLEPMLGPLGDNDGKTLTMALLDGSPALNAGDDALLAAPFNLVTDQRGLPRKFGTQVDIGAFESGWTAITSQPQSQTVLHGAAVTFSVAVSSTLPVTYQWRFNGTNLPDATNSSLAISNVQPADQGLYSVSANHGFQTVMSRSATLSLIALSITSQPQSQALNVGGKVSFSVGVSSTRGIAYQWQLNGANLAGATNSSLTLANVQLTDQGSYSVAVFDSYDSVMSDPATLRLRLTITGQPSGQTVLPRGTATFSVSASGSQPITYQWYFNGGHIADATNSSITLTNVQLAGQGFYLVVLRDSFETVLSRTATVRVHNPVITQAPLSQSVVAGGSVTLSVSISGSPPPFLYQWRRGSTVLTNMVLDETNCFFTLTNVEPEQGGPNLYYWVIVTNAVSTDLSLHTPFQLTVLADSDGDGLPDSWEIAHGLDPNNRSDATQDRDGDGLTNWQEYIAGTDPRDPQRNLKVNAIRDAGGMGGAELQFLAVSNRTYTVQSRDAVNHGPWSRVADVVAVGTNRVVDVTDSTAPAVSAQRFYRLVTPRVP